MDCGAFGITGFEWLFHKTVSRFASPLAYAGDPGFREFQDPFALLGGPQECGSCFQKGTCHPGL